MNDDMGNIESSYFSVGEPLERKQERQAEKAKVQGGRELLLELIERWETKIEFYQTIDSIPAEVRADSSKFMLAVAANDLTKRNLQAELDYLTALQEQYL